MSIRILLIPVLFILSITFSKALDKKDEYFKLVDYVNCKYAIEYIELKKSEISSNDYKKDFDRYKDAFNNNVKSYSDIYNGFNKTVEKSTPIYETLKKSANNLPKAKALWRFIDDKKEEFNSEWTKEEMIDFLVLLSDNEIKVDGQKVNFKTFLEATSNSIKKDLKKQDINIFINEHVEDKITELSVADEPKADEVGTIAASIDKSEADKTKRGNNQRSSRKDRETGEDINNSSVSFLGGLPFKQIFFFVILITGSYFAFKKRNGIKKIISRFKSNFVKKEDYDNIKLSKKYKDIETENINLRKLVSDIEQLGTRNKQLEEQIKGLQKRIIELTGGEKPPEGKSGNSQPKINTFQGQKEEGQVSNKPTQLYADAIINGEFYRTKEQPNDDTVFELKLTPSAKQATFNIYPEAFRRVIKNPDFVDGCEKQKINPQPNFLEVEKGEATLDDFGKWKITKKAIVKFV
ncbi:MAG TPA: hypothetical protein PLC80_00970 [Draconibacterium sp.]|nr:hypothetical protein [Draconibacterium sp.]